MQYVTALIRFFVAMCLLRKNPQDVPNSLLLLYTTIAANIALTTMMQYANATVPVAAFNVVHRLPLLLRQSPSRYWRSPVRPVDIRKP